MAAAETAPGLPLEKRIGPPAGRLILLWAIPTLISVESALFLLWPVPETLAAVMIGGGVALSLLLTLSAVARLSLMELTGNLEYGTKFWVMLVHLLIFLAPLLYLYAEGYSAPLSLGLVALTFPLSAVLVYPRACHYLLAVLLLLWWGLLAGHPEIPPALPLAIIALLTVAAGATHLHFRHMRYQQTTLRLWPSMASALIVFTAALPAALLIWVCLPRELFIRAPSLPAARATPTPMPASQLQAQLFRLLVETTLILAAAFVLLYIAGRLLKRFRRRGRPLPGRFDSAADEGEEWRTAHPPPRGRRRRGQTIRERIVAAYLDAADKMGERGWEFPSHRTAREFLGEARERGFAGRSALGELTALFEQAEYRGGEFDNVDLRRALDASEAVGKVTHRG